MRKQDKLNLGNYNGQSMKASQNSMLKGLQILSVGTYQNTYGPKRYEDD